MRGRAYKTPVLLIAVGAALLTATIEGQSGASAQRPGAAPASNWTLSRLPWGDPDLEGIWGVGYVFTPLERSKELAAKEFLTDAEVAALEKKHAAERQGNSVGGRQRGERGSVADVEGAYNAVFSRSGAHERWVRTRRTSLVVDPPDGRIPTLTPDGQKRLASFRRDQTNEFGPGGPADHPEQRRSDRCLGTTLPFIQGVSSGMRRIVQTPGNIAMFNEDGHLGGFFRAIPLEKRPPLPASIHLYYGDSRGRWEGDTLVVEVTNFSNDTNFQGSGENMRLTERYTRTAADLIIFRVTIEDPTTFTRPWTIEVPLTKSDEKANQIYESSCHEGNYAMTSILAGARALEKEKAQQKPKAASKAPQ